MFIRLCDVSGTSPLTRHEQTKHAKHMVLDFYQTKRENRKEENVFHSSSYRSNRAHGTSKTKVTRNGTIVASAELVPRECSRLGNLRPGEIPIGNSTLMLYPSHKKETSCCLRSSFVCENLKHHAAFVVVNIGLYGNDTSWW